uniref:Helicase ATP-binding domain-containing protein n=1 Tax=viral metagenome TaxID=1070528 RepID=A0A6C0HFZ6_9ZZZZ
MVIMCDKPLKSEDYENYFQSFSPLQLSSFQKWAVKAIVDKDNVLVTAHTGSGKTLPAEFAIQYFTQKNKKVIYASPIKALSNQKLYDFRRKFPNISFGILTGDCKDNPDADVLIMTTEILRNTLWAIPTAALVDDTPTNDTPRPPEQQSELPFKMDFANDLAAVIFDEVHYINDVERGSVWEQAILLLPPQVQLIMLSATLDKPEGFASWIEKEKNKQAIEKGLPIKQMYLASTYERAVPLTHYMWLSMPSKTFKRAKDTAIEKNLPALHNIPIVIAESNGTYNEKNYQRVQNVLNFMSNNDIHCKRQYVLDELLRYLNKNEMLPAICFIFSRKQVEQTAKEISFSLFEANSPLPGLVEHECRHILSNKLPNYKEYIELPEYKEIVQLLQKGIAIHHAGIMPVLREMVELLFEKGFVKLLCATETFAVGINMPTKTVMFTGLTKFNGSTMRQLYPHEYTQMAGRAGRRGLDTIGHVIHCSNLFEIPLNTDYKNMLTGAPQTLTSKFKVSFHLLLNILATTSDRNVVNKFVEQSLLASDIKKEIAYYEQVQEDLEIQLILKREILDTCKTPLCVMTDYNHIITLLPSTTNSAKRKLRTDMTYIEAANKTLEADLKKFANYNEIVEKLERNKKNKKNSAGYIYFCVDQIEKILSISGFINIDHKLSDKGRIASQLQEVHPLVFADMYTMTDGFAALSTIDIVSLFSCYTSVSVSDDIKTHNPNTFKLELNDMAKDMFTMLERYYSMELSEEVDTGSLYDIHFDLMNYVIHWCNATNEAECKAVITIVKVEKNIFLGEFIKAILKINNIAKEFEKVCEVMNNMTLLEKLKEIPSLTLKYVVANQSLYI